MRRHGFGLALGLVLGLVLGVTACSGSEPARVGGGRAEGEPATDPAEPAEPIPATPGPAPTVRVHADLDLRARAAVARIESLGPEPAEVGTLLVQRRVGTAWEEVPATLALRDSCDSPPVTCVTLVPGASYLPPAWRGQVGDAQCDCDRCAPAEAGTYRFVVRGCGATEPAEGEPFELPR